jgi:hypothetical protein
MKEPAHCDASIPMGIRATPRGDQCPVMPGALLAQLRRIVVRVSEDVPHLQRQLLQPLGGDDVVGVTGDGTLRGQGLQTLPTTTARGSFQPYHQP